MEAHNSNTYPSVPKLASANYAPWLFAIEHHAQKLEPTAHLTYNPPVPIDPTEQQEYIQRKTRLTTAILTSVPPDILGQILVPDDEITAYELIKRIPAHINQTTK